MRKQGKRWWRKTQRNLFYTLDKSLLLIRNICSKSSGGKPLNSSGKTGENPLENLLQKQCPNPQIYRARKTSRWGLSGLPVDHPVDRQRSKIRPLEPPVERRVDPKEQRALLSVPVDWVGRPAICQVKACTSVHVGRPSWSIDFRVSRLVR